MGHSIRPLRDEAPAAFHQLERRVEVQERIPSGVRTIGGHHLAIIPAVRVERSGDQTIPTSTTTTMSWTVEVRDTASMHDNSTNPSRLTAPVAGLYLFECGIQWASNVTGQRQVATTVNGGASAAAVNMLPVAGAASSIHFLVCSLQLAAGDYVEATVFQTSGGDLVVQAAGERTYAALTWLGNV